MSVIKNNLKIKHAPYKNRDLKKKRREKDDLDWWSYEMVRTVNGKD